MSQKELAVAFHFLLPGAQRECADGNPLVKNRPETEVQFLRFLELTAQFIIIGQDPCPHLPAVVLMQLGDFGHEETVGGKPSEIVC